MKIALKPINNTQAEFKTLCEMGGGPKGGPARTQVQKLLRSSGKGLYQSAYTEIAEHLAAFPDRNPWHVCFALGLCWGHLARPDLAFTDAATSALAHWNDADVNVACSFHLERGSEPIKQSLQGGFSLFERVALPAAIPTSLSEIQKFQNAWLRPIGNKTSRPKYIGTWNATAMFMVALFSMPKLAATVVDNSVLLPPGGPISTALNLLHQCHLLKHPPAAKLDEAEVELGAIVEDNGSFAELRAGLSDWSMLDVHSGLYMLGTRYEASKSWFAGA